MTDAYDYKAFGLHIRTPFPCPPLIPASADSVPDVRVEYGPVPLELKDRIGSYEFWEFNEAQYLFSNRFVRFLVADGETVTFDPSACLNEYRMSFHVRFNCFGMLLHQRNILVFHANISKILDGAIAVMGEPGAGKSTLLDALIRTGRPMMSDDLGAVVVNDGEEPTALSGFPQYKLCEQAVKRFDRSGLAMEQIRRRRGKYLVAAPEGGFSDRPAPVKAVYYIDFAEGSKVEVGEIKGIERFMLLRDQAIGADLTSQREAVFPQIASLSDKIPMFRISRPREKWTAEELVDIVTGEKA